MRLDLSTREQRLTSLKTFFTHALGPEITTIGSGEAQVVMSPSKQRTFAAELSGENTQHLLFGHVTSLHRRPVLGVGGQRSAVRHAFPNELRLRHNRPADDAKVDSGYSLFYRTLVPVNRSLLAGTAVETMIATHWLHTSM